MGGDKPIPYNEFRKGGVYPRPQVSEFCERLRSLMILRVKDLQPVWIRATVKNTDAAVNSATPWRHDPEGVHCDR